MDPEEFDALPPTYSGEGTALQYVKIPKSVLVVETLDPSSDGKWRIITLSVTPKTTHGGIDMADLALSSIPRCFFSKSHTVAAGKRKRRRRPENPRRMDARITEKCGP